MVDRQTPTVESDEELTREAEAKRDVDAAPTDGRRAAESRTDSRTTEDQPADTRARADDRRTPDTQRATTTEAAAGDRQTALFDRDASHDLQERWLVIQTQF